MENNSPKATEREPFQKATQSGSRAEAGRLCRWMQSPGPDFQDAALQVLLKRAHQLPELLETAEIHNFVIAYFGRRLRSSGNAIRGTELKRTASALAETFLAFTDVEPVPMEILNGLKELAAETVRRGHPAVREILVEHCLEKLFESRRIAAMFADWQEHPVLAAAHRQALAWGEGFWLKTRQF